MFPRLRLTAIYLPLALLLLEMTAVAAPGSMISYDSSSNQLPADPPFRYLDTAGQFGSSVSPSISAGIATLGPTSTPGRSFWYTDTLTLNHSLNVDIQVRLKVDSESSTDPTDAAGVAIAFSNDQDVYQNLFLSTTEVFFSKLNIAGTDLVRDTSLPVDTTQWHTYDIQFLGNNITLSIDGTQELTTTFFNLASTGQLVLPDYVAVGDIVTNGQSLFDLTNFNVSVVPEPSNAAAIALAVAAIVAVRLRTTGIKKS